METLEEGARVARAEDQEDDGHPSLPRLLFAAPLLGAFVLLCWSPTASGAVAALGWALPALVMAIATFTLAESRVLTLLPGLGKGDISDFARFCVTPVWIAEALRMVIGAGCMAAGRAELCPLFRNVFDPLRSLSNPGELLTVAGIIALFVRVRFVANRSNRGIGNGQVTAAVAAIAAVMLLTYVLGGLAGMFAMASTATQAPVDSARGAGRIPVSR